MVAAPADKPMTAQTSNLKPQSNLEASSQFAWIFHFYFAFLLRLGHFNGENLC